MAGHVDWLRLFSSAVEQIDESVVLTDRAGVILYVNGAITHFIATGTDVTGAKLAEKQITDSAERLALSVRGSNDGLFPFRASAP